MFVLFWFGLIVNSEFTFCKNFTFCIFAHLINWVRCIHNLSIMHTHEYNICHSWCSIVQNIKQVESSNLTFYMASISHIKRCFFNVIGMDRPCGKQLFRRLKGKMWIFLHWNDTPNIISQQLHCHNKEEIYEHIYVIIYTFTHPSIATRATYVWNTIIWCAITAYLTLR